MCLCTVSALCLTGNLYRLCVIIKSARCLAMTGIKWKIMHKRILIFKVVIEYTKIFTKIYLIMYLIVSGLTIVCD